jgi:hypothetical protein
MLVPRVKVEIFQSNMTGCITEWNKVTVIEAISTDIEG